MRNKRKAPSKGPDRIQVNTGSASTQGRDLFAFLGERIIAKLADGPIEVEFRFADAVRTIQIEKGHPWHKELSRRRAEALCGSLKRASIGQIRKASERRRHVLVGIFPFP